VTLINDDSTRRRVLLEDAAIGELTDRQLFETLAAAYVLISELRVEAARRRLAFFADVPVGMGRADASSSVFSPGPLVPPGPQYRPDPTVTGPANVTDRRGFEGGPTPPPPPDNSVIRKP